MNKHKYADMDDASKWNVTMGNIDALAGFLLQDYDQCAEDFLKMGDHFMNVPLSWAQGAFGSITFLIVLNEKGGVASDHIATAARINALLLEHRNQFFSTNQELQILMRRDVWWTYVTSMYKLVDLAVLHNEPGVQEAMPNKIVAGALDVVFPKEWVGNVASCTESVLKFISSSTSLSGNKEDSSNGKVLH